MFQIVLLLHISIGVLGIIAFWVPIFARKGGVNHVRFGKIFKYSAYFILSMASLLVFLRFGQYWSAGQRPWVDVNDYGFSLFLLYLAYTTFSAVSYGTGVLQHKRQPEKLNTPARRAIAFGGISFSMFVVLYALLFRPSSMIILLALSPIGFLGGIGQLRYMKSTLISKHQWLYEHLGSMIGGGIAYHTAFLVFGANRVLSQYLQGNIAVIPWVLPAIVGILASILWKRKYQLQYGEVG